MANTKALVVTTLAILFSVSVAAADIGSDRAECAQELVLLSTCLEYVQGSARAPTPDCCAGLGRVRGEKPKCLCVLIKDRDSPDLGVKINATLAISLPVVCQIAANISRCPKLLNLPPNSKDAEIFTQPGVAVARGNGTSSSSSSSSAAATTAAPGAGLGNANSVAHSGVGLEKVGGIWIYSVMSLLSIIFVAF